MLVISTAAGQKNGQSDQKRNIEKENIEYRIMNVKYRRNVFYLFNKKDWEQRHHPSKFCGSIFVILRFTVPSAGSLIINKPCHFSEVSYEEYGIEQLSLSFAEKRVDPRDGWKVAAGAFVSFKISPDTSLLARSLQPSIKSRVQLIRKHSINNRASKSGRGWILP